MRLSIFDTTLRDGAQSPGISFTVSDKLRIAAALDDFGVDFIEAGNPGANPRDAEFFKFAEGHKLAHAKLVAFTSTRRADERADSSESLSKIVAAGTEIVTVFGKSSRVHVEKILRVSESENLAMTADSIRFLTERGKRVFFDAEHFFDAMRESEDYAVSVVRTAIDAGAEAIILCDTNGGNLPDAISSAVRKLTVMFPSAAFGIHCHDDTGLAAAATISAVQAGACHIQGTINGLGERCGNTNLCTVIPTLQLKLGYECVPPDALKNLTQLARFVANISNSPFDERMPYTGGHAFTHKAGMHIDAMQKLPGSFEHVPPESVGNERNMLVSEISGRAALIGRFLRLDENLTKDSDAVKRAADLIKKNERGGFTYEDAEGSLTLLLLEALGKRKTFYTVETFRIVLSEPSGTNLSAALIKVKVGDCEEITAEEGDGPVNAIDKALRKALTRFYPKLAEMKLVDFKVRVLDSTDATASVVRVQIESADNARVWRTIGVSADIIDASWNALKDSVEYKLSCDEGLI
ncbi:citramalate synthase [Clostridia bacterium]|nr:citramalate synthase [Clostridia bacterium]